MSEILPAGWSSATVDNLARYVNGLAFRPADWGACGRPIIRIQNLTGSEKFNFTTRTVHQDVIVRKGDILVSWSATLDVFVWSGPEAVLNQHIFKVIPSEHINDHIFLRWALKNAIEELWASEHSHGTTMKHVNRGPFLAHPAKLPPSREQTRIAEAIESYFTRLDDAVASLERMQRNLKRYRASVLKAAVEGRLVPTEAELARAEGRDYEPASVLLERILAERRRRWEEAELVQMKMNGEMPQGDKWKAKYQEPARPDTTDLPELPDGWCWTSIEEVGDVTGGITQNAKRTSLPLQLPFLRVANVYANELRLDEVKSIGISESEFARARLAAGDLLVVEGNGSIEQIGRVALWDGSVEPCLHQNHLIKVRFSPVELAGWCLCWLLAPLGRAAIERAASSTSGLHTLSLSKIGRMPFPLAPLAEQLRVTAEVDRLLTIEAATTSEVTLSAARCARLRQSILRWAFEGRLVDQDPADEPASKLLERIKSERAAQPARSPTRRARRATSQRKNS